MLLQHICSISKICEGLILPMAKTMSCRKTIFSPGAEAIKTTHSAQSIETHIQEATGAFALRGGYPLHGLQNFPVSRTTRRFVSTRTLDGLTEVERLKAPWPFGQQFHRPVPNVMFTLQKRDFRADAILLARRKALLETTFQSGLESPLEIDFHKQARESPTNQKKSVGCALQLFGDRFRGKQLHGPRGPQSAEAT